MDTTLTSGLYTSPSQLAHNHTLCKQLAALMHIPMPLHESFIVMCIIVNTRFAVMSLNYMYPVRTTFNETPYNYNDYKTSGQ